MPSLAGRRNGGRPPGGAGLSRATAAQALLGKTFRVTRHRGEFVESSLAPYVMATLRPSAILRAPDEKERQEQEK